MSPISPTTRTPLSGSAPSPRTSASKSAVLALAICASMLALVPAYAATSKPLLDAGGKVVSVEDGVGIPANNPRVKSILEAHPNDFVVICVAGCDGKPTAVQVLPRPVVGRTGEYVPTAAPTSPSTAKGVYGPPKPNAGQQRVSETSNDVVCLAGCMGKPGSILQRIKDLPPPSEPKSVPVLPSKP